MREFKFNLDFMRKNLNLPEFVKDISKPIYNKKLEVKLI